MFSIGDKVTVVSKAILDELPDYRGRVFKIVKITSGVNYPYKIRDYEVGDSIVAAHEIKPFLDEDFEICFP